MYCENLFNRIYKQNRLYEENEGQSNFVDEFIRLSQEEREQDKLFENIYRKCHLREMGLIRPSVFMNRLKNEIEKTNDLNTAMNNTFKDCSDNIEGGDNPLIIINIDEKKCYSYINPNQWVNNIIGKYNENDKIGKYTIKEIKNELTNRITKYIQSRNDDINRVLQYKKDEISNLPNDIKNGYFPIKTY